MISIVLGIINLFSSVFGNIHELHLYELQVRPTKVDYCELVNAPQQYNHSIIQITAFVHHGFESFSLHDPKCRNPNGVWLEYGGQTNSDTIYCCGTAPNESRDEDIVVEGISIPLNRNERFSEFGLFAISGAGLEGR
jgi:hypothetical protein